MDESEFIEVKAEKVTVEEIKQVVIKTTNRRKQATLFHLIEKHRPFLERSEQMKKTKRPERSRQNRGKSGRFSSSRKSYE
ncbi:hypothetical protein [Pallidibacillus pasinlerensis]|uniref:hypothetical protein n=1 Tax=Pallidibacillus pasinlerensis TaxID=2703818 RepID=UPI001FE4AA27|nr:hypothetical protein [Pallidibacillus pasinlerensis]